MPSARSHFDDDPISGLSATVTRVQPFQATKSYTCPGCNNEIAVGVGHLVVVPLGRVDERRHWHSSCWERRLTIRPGR
ncbi:MAG TPA: hypothetical protein VNE42_11680 [Acidimicrobiales bacterium]|nr:hypothetical protein [Acidimicrobiales bacterium]